MADQQEATTHSLQKHQQKRHNNPCTSEKYRPNPMVL
jgi:hypothetical protein